MNLSMSFMKNKELKIVPWLKIIDNNLVDNVCIMSSQPLETFAFTLSKSNTSNS